MVLPINTRKLNSPMRTRAVDLEASLGSSKNKFLVPLSWLGGQEQPPMMIAPSFVFPSVLTQRPGHCSPTLTTVPGTHSLWCPAGSHAAELHQTVAMGPCTLLCYRCALHAALQQCTGAHNSELCTLVLSGAVPLWTLTGVPCLHAPLVLTVPLCTHPFLKEPGLQTHSEPFQPLKE